MSLVATKTYKTALTASVVLLLTACGDETTPVYVSPAEVTIQNPDPITPKNQAPVAKISVIELTEDGIQLSAIDSTDPDGDGLRQFLWQVTAAPENSLLKNSIFNAAEAPGITYIQADQTGEYTLQLRVYDGKIWSEPVSQTFELQAKPKPKPDFDLVRQQYQRYYDGNPRQALTLGLDQAAANDTTICELTSKPANSSASSNVIDAQHCGLTPDQIGQYQITAKSVRNDGRIGIDLYTFSVNVTAYSVPQPLAYTPSATEYSRSLQQLVMLDNNASLLHLYDISSKKSFALGLPLIGNAVGLSADGKFATIMQDGRLSYLDIAQRKLLRSISLGSTAYAEAVLMLDSQRALIFEKNITDATSSYDPISNQWIYTSTFKYALVALDTGKITKQSLKLKGSSYTSIGELQFIRQDDVTLVKINQQLWSLQTTADDPNAITLKPTTGNQNLQQCSNGYYIGDRAPLFLANKGQRLFKSCGESYQYNPTNQRLSYAGRLTSSINSLDMSTALNRLLVTDSRTGQINEYDARFLGLQRQLPLPMLNSADHQRSYSSNARAAFYLDDQGRHVVLMKVDPVMGTTNEYAVTFSQ